VSPYVRVEEDALDEEDEATLVGVEEVEESATSGGEYPGTLPAHPAVIPVPIQSGQPVAQALPSAFAVAGPFGFAQVSNFFMERRRTCAIDYRSPADL